ncbi:MAG: hypothetical protein LBJ00_14410 [Planctomycetaceae bacterium]|nr:hypothetical protein [Planctomycetaceae bacterium]
MPNQRQTRSYFTDNFRHILSLRNYEFFRDNTVAGRAIGFALEQPLHVVTLA